MKSVLILDFETTGLDLNTARIIEGAFCIWDIERHVPIETHSMTIQPSGGFQFEAGAERVSKITAQEIEKGESLTHFLMRMDSCIRKWKPSHLVGHNIIEYDRELLWNECQRIAPDLREIDATLIDLALIFELPVFDTLHHLPHPEGERRGLDQVAIKHDILPLFPHRALGDVLTTGKILSKYDFDSLAPLTRSPIVTITTLASYEVAKLYGFHWSKESQRPERVLPLFKLQALTFPFEIIPVPPYPSELPSVELILIEAQVKYEQKDMAKAQGFRWNGEAWVKLHTKKDLENIVYPFPSKILERFTNADLPRPMGHASFFSKAPSPWELPVGASSSGSEEGP